MRFRDFRGALATSAAICAVAVASPALAQVRSFNVPAQSAATGIPALAIQADIQILVSQDAVRGKNIRAIKGRMSVDQAVRRVAADAGLRIVSSDGRTYALAPQSSGGRRTPTTGAVDDSADDEIIVTAQKKEEKIVDVPIAISAFSKEALDDHKIEGGSELLRAVPNVNFSKANFSGYNFSIRGIGTKAVSSSTDPAVAVSFNNTPLIRNRLFEQEFFDVQRVEVLRGPQGTLYGRNATGGVVNVLPALPGNMFEGEAKVEIGNYDTRRASGMINIPLTDTFAVRAAGAYTKRSGFDYNSFNDTRVNGRDLWSTRLSAQWEPFGGFRANFIWQHFEEDDNRSRTGKQLCTRDDGPTMVGDTVVHEDLRARLSQGCKPGSLFDDAAYGVVNAESFPHVFIASNIGFGFESNPDGSINFDAPINAVPPGVDPYAGRVQSRNLREIETSYDPVFRARNDLFQFNLEFGLSDGLQLITQTAYARDRYYSSQDYNRFVSNPIFGNSTTPGIVDVVGRPVIANATPGGFYNDPQLGPSDRMLSVDLSRSANEQWTQELRLQSSWDGPFNFSIGANYLDFRSKDDYYVFNNFFSLVAEYFYNRKDRDDPASGAYIDTKNCQPTGPSDAGPDCIYLDPNPLNAINGDGHNYFRSKNVVRTESYALFGEAYLKLADNFKLTAGMRYTDDTKVSTPYPSQLLLGLGQNISASTGGKVAIGFVPQPDIKQQWRRFSGRVVADWKPELAFTDDTLIYASFSHGYKGGGSNPPRVDFDPAIVRYQPLAQTFRPEYVNAFEIGTKNSFMDGRMTLNVTGFYYDYTNYQVSQIVDRISLNENFDATSMGLEFEAAWRPSRAFRVDANLGYLKTRIKDGERSIDVMNRTQGNKDWVVVRPWVQVPSNCVAPREAVERILNSPLSQGPGGGIGAFALAALCASSNRIGDYTPEEPNGPLPFSAFYGFTYDPLLPYIPNASPLGVPGGAAPGSGAPNGGQGFYADLGGNELPNSPHLTFNIGAQYSFFFDAFELTLRGDYYRQSGSFARVYNSEYDRLRGWDNANISITLENSDWGVTAQAYVKNLFNNTPITDSFTNSDDTGLTANVFTLDPRIIGFSIAKKF